MMTSLPNGWHRAQALFSGGRLTPNHGLHIADGIVTETGPAPAGSPELPGTLAPGFIDLQVNGGGGAMFNSTPTRAGLQTIAQAHRSLGTSALLATVITDAPEVLAQAADTALTGLPDGIIGLHIEGPHIALAKRGTHAAEHIRPLDETTLSHVQRLRQAHLPVMITLAPEAATPEQIAQLAQMGAVVSLGHTNATAEDIHNALAAGAQAGTHLFNAMSQMTARAPAAVGALLNSTAHLGLIADGIHVAPEMLTLACRARPQPDRMFLVSDAMATVGGPDHFSLYGQTIRVSQGRLINAEGNLAGAHTTMAEGVALMRRLGLPLDEVLRMAITTPAQLIGRPELGSLEGQKVENLVQL